MKASVYGIDDFLFGKKSLPDERLNRMKEIYRSVKITAIQVEFVTDKDLKTADVIVCLKDKKLDLVIMDMEIIENKLSRDLSDNEKKILKQASELLEKEMPLYEGEFSEEDSKWLANNNFVTIKPIVLISREEMEDMPALTRKVYDSSGRISFLTGGVKESRAWEAKKNPTAVEAAHCIHSDIARGFIRAEVLSYDDLLKVGNANQAKNEGFVKSQGKEYIVKDGDIIDFKFNV
ncbi:MAG: DUF933 domain-containing protein [Candidatus Omnitrophota bacterium]